VAVQGRLRVGDRVRLVSRPVCLELAVGGDGVLEIGEGAFINYGGSIAATKHVQIGKNCSIGTHVLIMDNEFHRLEPGRRNEMPDSRPIVLEDNVWLGARVIVLPGVTIGENSVVGAGSVVTRDVPANVIAAGVPARVLRPLDGTVAPLPTSVASRSSADSGSLLR
jgi:acetyltransferase-like isoleucine patch superfamily enzyme